jgi:hypothetical protein
VNSAGFRPYILDFFVESTAPPANASLAPYGDHVGSLSVGLSGGRGFAVPRLLRSGRFSRAFRFLQTCTRFVFHPETSAGAREPILVVAALAPAFSVIGGRSLQSKVENR